MIMKTMWMSIDAIASNQPYIKGATKEKTSSRLVWCIPSVPNHEAQLGLEWWVIKYCCQAAAVAYSHLDLRATNLKKSNSSSHVPLKSSGIHQQQNATPGCRCPPPGCTASRHRKLWFKGPEAAHFTVLHVVHVVHVAIDDFDVFLLSHIIHHQRGDLGGRRWPRSPGGRAMKCHPNFVQPRYENRELTKSSAHKGSQAIYFKQRNLLLPANLCGAGSNRDQKGVRLTNKAFKAPFSTEPNALRTYCRSHLNHFEAIQIHWQIESTATYSAMHPPGFQHDQVHVRHLPTAERIDRSNWETGPPRAKKSAAWHDSNL